MHGIRKHSKPKTEEELSAIAVKVAQYKEVTKQIFEIRSKSVHDHGILQATANVLRLNPDFSTLWNYRREIFLHLVASNKNTEITRENPDTPDIEDIQKEKDENATIEKELCDVELELTMEAIQRNPKSYPAWFHREWIMKRGYCDLNKELQLCSKFLELDERNFHCWNYRRLVAAKANRDSSSELVFTTEKINQNFSNYSAFHYRTMLLSIQDISVIEEEIDIVKQAVFTEPDDQSAWLYHRWLITTAISSLSSTSFHSSHDQVVTLVEDQVKWCEELYSIENESKWTLSALAFLHGELALLSENNRTQNASQCRELYHQLSQLDPDHSCYYEDMIFKLSSRLDTTKNL